MKPLLLVSKLTNSVNWINMHVGRTKSKKYRFLSTTFFGQKIFLLICVHVKLSGRKVMYSFRKIKGRLFWHFVNMHNISFICWSLQNGVAGNWQDTNHNWHSISFTKPQVYSDRHLSFEWLKCFRFITHLQSCMSYFFENLMRSQFLQSKSNNFI